MNKKTTQEKGAVLLIAILVSSVALAVGFGVYNRTYKELLFASFWKQTQVAFAAADAGLECAIYWGTHTSASPQCFGSNIPWTLGSTVAAPGVDMVAPGGGCVNIRIIWDGIATTTEARGYNTCDTANPRRVERGLKASY